VSVRTGLDVLAAQGFDRLKGRRVGLVTNPSAVDRHLHSACHLLRNAPGVKLAALFAPEHGLAGAAPDAERIGSMTDPRTGLPVYSLYGETYYPTPEMLEGLDALVFDIQDVGARYYTFTWTLSYVLEAAGENGLEVIVLDRPNPLNGRLDGPPLEPHLSSFVGRFPVPVCHGLTLGELAGMMNALWNACPADLTVARCENYRRGMAWEDTGLVWVPPSPNMPHTSTVRQYPGACLVEGTNLSEGRGTALPFEIVGTPWIDGDELAAALNAQDWPGVRFRPISFRPSASKWAGLDCGGVQAHVFDNAVWRPVETWLNVIITVRRLYPAHFAWLPPAAAGVEPGGVYHFDRLAGSEQIRAQIEAGAEVSDISGAWPDFWRGFKAQRKPFLLYENDDDN
jgi:uncharacterized protein YbbC (DUF1343 family)